MLYPIVTLLVGFCAFFPPFQSNEALSPDTSVQAELRTDHQNWKHHERVFNDDLNLISELTWTTNTMPMQGVQFSFSPSGQGTFHLNYLQIPDHHDGFMSDADWDDSGAFESYSTSTARMTQAFSSDFWITLPLATYVPSAQAFWSPDRMTFSLLTGVHGHKSSWDVYGLDLEQRYQEDDGTWSLWTDHIPHNQQIGTYTSGAIAPYVGLGIETFFDRLTLSMNLRYSEHVKHQDLDVHGLRGLVFHDTTGYRGLWMGFDLQAKYHLSPHWSVHTGYTLDHFKKAQGTTDVYDMYTEELLYKNLGVSGFESKHRGLMLGLEYAF